MKITHIAAALALTAFPAASQNTQRLSASKANDFGIVYSLPVNAFDVTLEAEAVIERPGELALYARQYLGKDPILRPSTRWTLKSAQIAETAVADPSEQYVVQFKNSPNTFFMLDADGLPLAVNIDEYPAPAPPPVIPVEKAAEPTVLDSPDAAYAVSSDMAAVTSTAKRAELAAAKIFEIRQTRSEILSGEAENMPSDGAAMKLVLDNLASQEAVLTALFLGTTQTCTQVRTVACSPQFATSDDRTIIARLSATKGIVDSADLSGAPVYLDVTVISRGELPLTEKGEERRLPKGALAYRIPGKADLSVVFAGRTYASGSFTVAQLGPVFGVDPGVFTDRKNPSYLIFDPLTGAVRELGTLAK